MSFLTGYFLGEEAARQEQRFKELAAAVASRFQQNSGYAEPTELDLAYARIAQLESVINYACSVITKLEADAEYSHKWAEWAKGEIDRLGAVGARLTKQLSEATARVRELETAAEVQRVAVLDNIRRALRDDDDELSF